MTLRAIQDHILVSDMEFKERISRGGLVLLSDDKKSEGIRPRWGKVAAVGKDEHTVKVGQWVMVKHGRWTRGVQHEDIVIRRIDNDDILCVSDEKPSDETFSGSDIVNNPQNSMPE
jgi:co-chaperonin GroES (HSP10)